MSTTFVSGGAYGLDGIRFNPRTNALFANEFIKLINQKLLFPQHELPERYRYHSAERCCVLY